MEIKEKYGHLCIILLSGITLGLICGGTETLGIYYDHRATVEPLILATAIPAITLGITGLVGIISCLASKNK